MEKGNELGICQSFIHQTMAHIWVQAPDRSFEGSFLHLNLKETWLSIWTCEEKQVACPIWVLQRRARGDFYEDISWIQIWEGYFAVIVGSGRQAAQFESYQGVTQRLISHQMNCLCSNVIGAVWGETLLYGLMFYIQGDLEEESSSAAK